MAHFDNRGSVTNQANNQYFQPGSQLIINSPAPSALPPDYDLGVRLGVTPQIDDSLFIGRQKELQQLQTWLVPTLGKQKIVAVWGMGGVGKTQLSLQFIRRAGEQYSAVYWLDAKDASTLKAGLAALALEMSEIESTPIDGRDEDFLVQYARRWLSRADNGRWLLVYDNYDDPKLPSMNSTTGYDIRAYFPPRAHGSILITTRSSELNFAAQIPLQKLKNNAESLSILATRSGRFVDGDPLAIELVRRFDGLPLALATAGSYLCQSTDSFEDYLQLYEKSWSELRNDGGGPIDYTAAERTLYTTWNVSLKQIQDRDKVAVELLRLMAYFDNKELWYELFDVGHDLENPPTWWVELMQNRIRFSRATRTLCEYSILDLVDGKYSLHPCVQDWITESLNQTPDQQLYRIAAHCMAKSISPNTQADYWVANRRLLSHARRLQHNRLQQNHPRKTTSPTVNSSLDLHRLGNLCSEYDMYEEAEKMYAQALRGLEQALGIQNTLTLTLITDFGSLYISQDRLEDAEQIHNRVLSAEDTTQKSDSPLLWSLGKLYIRQGKLEQAEVIFKNILGSQGNACREASGEAYGEVYEELAVNAEAMNALGTVYLLQGKLEEAETLFKGAITFWEQVYGKNDILAVDPTSNLSIVYRKRGKLEEAEQMQKRVLVVKEKTYGCNHTLTLETVVALGDLYDEQGRYKEAEQMFQRALPGWQDVLGPNHSETLDTAFSLIQVYFRQDKLKEAKAVCEQAIAQFSGNMGVQHVRIYEAMDNISKRLNNQQAVDD